MRRSAHRREDGALPTPAQVELLRAALLPGEDARRAWRRWRDRGLRIDALDHASARVLPQLWLNHEAAAIGAVDVPVLRGVYRQALAKNVCVLHEALEAVAVLERAGIPVVLIKGGATLARMSDRLGTRVVYDLDALVPEHRVTEAFRALAGAGFVPDAGIVRHVVATRHAWPVRRAGGAALDLHWYAYKTPGDDATVFALAEPRTLLGRTVLVPEVSEALLQTCVHGVGICPAPMRWIGDAAMLIAEAGETLDWQRVVARARDRDVTVAAAAAFAVLGDEVGAAVPGWVVSELRAERAAWRQRVAHRAVTRDTASVLYAVALEFHRRRRRHRPTQTPGLLAHLAASIGARNRRTIAWLFGRRLRRRLTGGPRDGWQRTVADWNDERRRGER